MQLHSKFISAIVGAALAFTSITATSAQAGNNGRYNQRVAPQPLYVQPQRNNGGGNEAVAAALAGVAALFIIGKTIERNNSARPKAHHAPRAHGGHRGHRAQRGHRGHQRAYRNDRGRGHWNGHRRHGRGH